MDWGKRIVILMVSFMIFIIAMSVVMFRIPDEADNQYYEKGLAFNADYAMERQVIIDHAQPQINILGKDLIIQFAEAANGRLNFLRPADGKMDEAFPLVSNKNNEVNIPLNAMKRGRWKLILNWESSGKKYLYTKEIDLP